MRHRRTIELALLTFFAGILAGCASAPPSGGQAVSSESQSAQTEPKVVQTTAQAEKYATEEQIEQARRECMRKLRRVTGSRIPRDACQGSMGLYSGAYNQHQEGSSRGTPGGSVPSE